MLRIGFDAKRAFLNNTGLGNYSRSVISSLAGHFPENQYLLYTPKLREDERTAGLLNLPGTTVRTPRVPLFRSAWRSRFIIRQLVADKLDLYHGLSHEIPAGISRTGIRTVVTIHDLIFLRYPQYYSAIDRKIYELKFRNACTYADIVIATSEQTKRDIVHFFGTPAEKIRVVYQTCDPQFEQIVPTDTAKHIREKYGLPETYLLYVGTIEKRKNLLLAVKALKHVTGSKLVVIGKETPYAARVHDFLKDHQLEERVIFLKQVGFSELPAIYQQAALFLYPSEFEGFGIPVLEALKSGVPVIAATGSCLEEAGGPGSFYVSPQDADELAAAINRVLHEPDTASRMVAAGKAYAAAFTEKAHAAALMGIYRELCPER